MTEKKKDAAPEAPVSPITKAERERFSHQHYHPTDYRDGKSFKSLCLTTAASVAAFGGGLTNALVAMSSTGASLTDWGVGLLAAAPLGLLAYGYQAVPANKCLVKKVLDNLSSVVYEDGHWVFLWPWESVEEVDTTERELEVVIEGVTKNNERATVKVNLNIFVDGRIGDHHGHLQWYHLSHAGQAQQAEKRLDASVKSFGGRLISAFTKEELEKGGYRLIGQLVEIYLRLPLSFHKPAKQGGEGTGFAEDQAPEDLVRWARAQTLIPDWLASDRAAEEPSEIEQLSGLCVAEGVAAEEPKFHSSVEEAGEAEIEANAEAKRARIAAAANAEIRLRAYRAAVEQGVTDPRELQRIQEAAVNAALVGSGQTAGTVMLDSSGTGEKGVEKMDKAWVAGELEKGESGKPGPHRGRDRGRGRRH